MPTAQLKERQNSQAEPVAGIKDALMDGEAAGGQNRPEANSEVINTVSASARRQMQKEQIEVSDPADLSLTQAVKNRRSDKQRSRKR